MDNAIVENAPQRATQPVWLTTLQAYLEPGRLLPLLAIVSAITFGIGLISWSTKADYVPIMPGLNQQDSAQVVEYLNSRNEPFTVDGKNGLILVPSDRASELQIELAGIGLPQSHVMGLELLRQDQPLGTSQFMEQARYRHALETELSRTVASMRNVDSARIHLAIPKRSVFVQRQTSASASVMVRMLPGRTLEQGQVRAIVNLVGSSVPYLDSANVTIVDEWGSLLSSEDTDELSEITSHQFAFSRKLEKHYAQRIEELLTPLIGPGRVRASVSADLDFSVEEQTAESYEADPAQIRSEQRQQQESAAASATGVPGALTNQPPAGTNPQQPPEAQETTDDTVSNITRNYELDKTISHVRNAPGKINRISASVVIDNIKSVNEAGESVDVPPTAFDLDQFTALVQGVIGFNEERGDSIMVFTKPFQLPEAMAPPEAAPVWEKPWVWTLARQVAVALLILFIVFSIIRPALLSLQPQRVVADVDPAANEDHVDGELAQDSASISLQGREKSTGLVAESHGDILLMARTMARDDPKRVARVVKDWVSEEKSNA